MSKLAFLRTIGLLLFFAVGFTAPVHAQSQQNLTEKVVAHIPNSTIGILSLWPKKLATKEQLQLAPLEVLSAAGLENVGIDPLSIQRIDVMTGIPGPMGPQFGALIQLSEPLDVTSLNASVIDDSGAQDDNGFTYHSLSIGPPGQLILHQVDAKTVIVGTLVFCKQMARNGDPSGQLAVIAAGVRSEQDAMAIVAVDAIRPMIQGVMEGQAGRIPPQVADDLRTIVELTEFVALRLVFAESETLQLVVAAADEQGAVDLEQSVTNALQFSRQSLVDGAKSQIDTGTLTGVAMHAYLDRVSTTIESKLIPKRVGSRLITEVDDFQNIGVIGTLTGLLLPAVQASRQAARRAQSSNNMKQLALSLLNFESAYNAFPATAGLDDDGEPLISWRVAMLPFLEESELYERFHLDEPWDSEHNIALLEEMPDVFKHPSRPTQPGYTVYVAPVGDETLLRLKEPTRLRDVTDGTSNTIMLIETTSDVAVPWTAPRDYEVDLENPMKNLFDKGITQAVFCDGSVHALSEMMDASLLKALFTRAGGEVTNF